MPRSRVIVLKFGGSSLRSERDLPRVVAEIDRWRRTGFRVVAVVSAFHGETDRLIAQAHRHAERPDPAALASLVATGEQAAAAALTLALDRAGLGARSFDSASAGLRTSGDALDATLIGLRSRAFAEAFDADEIAVVPGFAGRDSENRIALLGRGGSDYTALFIAASLGARCRLLKDVGGLYDRDPGEPGARRWSSVTWADAKALGGRVLQAKALRFAESAQRPFGVGGIDVEHATLVGAPKTDLDGEDGAPPRLRVALLGAGAVGLSVLRHVAARPEQFEVVGVAVRNAARAVARGVPSELVRTDAGELVAADCDVVFEAIGGVEPASHLLEAALLSGRHVVTVNKSALARRRRQLSEAAGIGGASLTFSGAVGGATPLLATAARLRERKGVLEFIGVLNGTSNYILDRLSQGETLGEAIGAAQALGFAEADPASDLSGVDAAEKLSLLSEAAFGQRLDPAQVELAGIDETTSRRCAEAERCGERIRMVASCRRSGGEIRASVRVQEVPAEGWLGGARDEWNAGVFRCADGAVERVRGRGAGGWPTAQAALWDLLELRRSQARTRACEEVAS